MYTPRSIVIASAAFLTNSRYVAVSFSLVRHVCDFEVSLFGDNGFSSCWIFVFPTILFFYTTSKIKTSPFSIAFLFSSQFPYSISLPVHAASFISYNTPWLIQSKNPLIVVICWKLLVFSPWTSVFCK